MSKNEGRCKTCAHWDKSAYRGKDAAKFRDYGLCGGIWSPLDMLGEWPSGGPWTHPDFGCINYEGKEPSNG